MLRCILPFMLLKASMRLINVHTLELEQFSDQACPPYGILSNTWEAEEVSFTDWQAPPDQRAELKGFEKIRSFCEIIESYGFDYAWVDTCCIDKSSSAELTESINSMYRYYQNASECIVYLADVHDCYYLSDDGLRSSRWFTRGWTLQELIAPTNVNFHSADWDLIGSLNDEPETNELISEYTGIAYSVLAKETTPSQWCIATRMSWASQRTTTRIEDEAYCLLGIFDVSLPLIYGEGRRAFIRLQEEIIRRTSDHSILAWNRIIEGQSECNDLLAASPANFKNALEDEIMQWSESYEISQPYSMTSLGLRMALPLVPCMPADDDGLSLSNNGKFFHAVLNCRLRSADRSLLCLNVSQDTKSARIRDRPGNADPIFLQPVPSQQLPQSICALRHLAVRLATVPEEELLLNRKFEVVILRQKSTPLTSGTRRRVTKSRPRAWRERILVTLARAASRRPWQRSVCTWPERDWLRLSQADVWTTAHRLGAITYKQIVPGSDICILLNSRPDQRLGISVVEVTDLDLALLFEAEYKGVDFHYSWLHVGLHDIAFEMYTLRPNTHLQFTLRANDDTGSRRLILDTRLWKFTLNVANTPQAFTVRQTRTDERSASLTATISKTGTVKVFEALNAFERSKLEGRIASRSLPSTGRSRIPLAVSSTVADGTNSRLVD